MMKMYLGIVGLVLVGVGGCGGASGEAACEPAGTWSVTASPAPGDDCAQPAETKTRLITVTNGTATITDPADGSEIGSGPLDSSCHMGFVKAAASPDQVAAGSADWTFTGATVSGTANANYSFADGTMCMQKLKLVGVRQ
jgi:hypothetical protein